MDLTKLADEYQTLADDLPVASIAAYAAQNAADKLHHVQSVVLQADRLIAAAATTVTECPRCGDGSACGAAIEQRDCPLGRGQSAA